MPENVNVDVPVFTHTANSRDQFNLEGSPDEGDNSMMDEDDMDGEGSEIMRFGRNNGKRHHSPDDQSSGGYHLHFGETDLVIQVRLSLFLFDIERFQNGHLVYLRYTLFSQRRVSLEKQS